VELGRGIGIEIRPHGYGIEMKFPAIAVDFDWGDRGEGYGFDLWRLWNHCEINQLFADEVTCNVLKRWFEQACASSELVGDRRLHYLAEERQAFALDSGQRGDSPGLPVEGRASFL
jgi:hypothetical protein